MIFVTVGNAIQGFDRLMKAIDTMAAANAFQEPVVVQFGNSRVMPRNCRCVRSVSREEFRDLVAGASLVITHGGAGSIGCCIQAGRKPVVVPRRRLFGEHVNDHQVDLVRVLADQMRVFPVFEIEDLPMAVRNASREGALLSAAGGGSQIRALVGEFLARLAEGTSGGAPKINSGGSE